MNNNNFKELDTLSLFGTFLGVMNFYLNSQQANNDDLLRELKKQDTEYLEKILENQKEILRRLETHGLD